MSLVGKYGFAWPRNKKNLAKIKALLKKKKGMYVLTHGAMPMYVGKGMMQVGYADTRRHVLRKIGTGIISRGL